MKKIRWSRWPGRVSVRILVEPLNRPPGGDVIQVLLEFLVNFENPNLSQRRRSLSRAFLHRSMGRVLRLNTRGPA